MKRSFLSVTFLLVALFTGCTHYHMGAPATLSFQSIYIEPIRNESYAPQAQALLADQLATAFIEDGRVRITSQKKADALLEITLKDFEKNVSATEESDTLVGRSFNITLVAQCTLINTKTGDILLHEVPISSTIDAFVDTGFQQSEYQAMPVLTRDLAKKIRDRVLSGWDMPAPKAQANTAS